MGRTMPFLYLLAVISGNFRLLMIRCFFLHHAQIDKLWWAWQQQDLPKRGNEYNGPSRTDSLREAALEDLIEMWELGPDIEVRQMMNTEAGDLCYRY